VKKYVALLFIVLLLINQTGFAQDNDNGSVISAGIGPEVNMNSREGFAGGLSLCIDYQLPVSAAQLAVGVIAVGSSNFSDTTVLEVGGMLRWYFLGAEQTGLFAQADLGVHLITEQEESVTLFEAGLRAGFRMPLGDSFYIEPYGRFGYPYFMGAGVLAGMRFQTSSNSSNNRSERRAESSFDNSDAEE